jgi:hypothetical protein
MSKKQWWAFPRMSGWRYEYSLRRGALTGIRPFGIIASRLSRETSEFRLKKQSAESTKLTRMGQRIA